MPTKELVKEWHTTEYVLHTTTKAEANITQWGYNITTPEQRHLAGPDTSAPTVPWRRSSLLWRIWCLRSTEYMVPRWETGSNNRSNGLVVFCLRSLNFQPRTFEGPTRITMLIPVGMDEGKNDMWISNFFSRIQDGNNGNRALRWLLADHRWATACSPNVVEVLTRLLDHVNFHLTLRRTNGEGWILHCPQNLIVVRSTEYSIVRYSQQ